MAEYLELQGDWSGSLNVLCLLTSKDIGREERAPNFVDLTTCQVIVILSVAHAEKNSVKLSKDSLSHNKFCFSSLLKWEAAYMYYTILSCSITESFFVTSMPCGEWFLVSHSLRYGSCSSSTAQHDLYVLCRDGVQYTVWCVCLVYRWCTVYSMIRVSYVEMVYSIQYDVSVYLDMVYSI